MTETAKTLTFLAVAAGAVLLAVVTRPSLPTSGEDNRRGQLLYPDFKDPLAVASLEIVEFDESDATVHPFQVQETDYKGKTRWVIPSHDNYPADASHQVADAATALMRTKILDTPSEAQGDQAEYGVVEPDPKVLKLGATGVGMKVVMKDKAGKELLALVIGKEVPNRPGLRYVRKVGQDPIYTVEARTDHFSTKFENWIERNLLQISNFDVKRLLVKDYAIRETAEGPEIDQRGRMDLDHNDAGELKWKMTDDQKLVPDPKIPAGARWAPVKMAADEELNTTKLDDMLFALDDLKIVDVSRKPAGLSADLRATGQLAASNKAAVQSLGEKGFYLARLESGPVEVFSNEGETRVGSKDGVEYILRFGDIAGRAAKKDEKKDAKQKGKAKEPEKKKEESATAGLNRYLFVMAEFNPELVAKPQFEPLPEPIKPRPAVAPEPAKKPAGASKDAKPQAAVPNAKPQAAAPNTKPPAAAPNAKKADAKKAEEKKPVEKTPAEKEAERKALQAERERVERDNKRLQEEYDQKIADGKKRVGELNARFADWYYVISDEVFRKIHLGRDEIVKKKEKPKDKGKGGKDEHAGHEHEDLPPAPADELEKLKSEGPGGK
jgi:hypothetical protein